MSKRETIFLTIQDLVSEFVYYGRKEDEDLSQEALDKAIENGDITVEEIVKHFEKHLKLVYPNKEQSNENNT